MAVPTKSNVANPRGMGYGCALNDRLYRIAAGPGRELTVTTAPPEAQRINTASSAEELAAEHGITFARSQFDGGEGLYRAHTRDADPTRFWDSKNVSVAPAAPGEFPEIKLLPAMERISHDFWFGSDDVYMLYHEGEEALYASTFNELYKISDPFAPYVPESDFVLQFWDDGEGNLGHIGGIVLLGEDLYVCSSGNGIHKRTAGTWAHWSDVGATRIWSVKGRLVASDGRSLYEVLSGGAAPTALHTLPEGKVWTDAVDGGSHVLAAASDGYIYAFVSEAGALSLVTQTPFEGEYPTALGQTQGVLAVGTTPLTSKGGRFYIGRLDESGQVTDLSLKKEWANTITSGYPRSILGTRSTLITSISDDVDTTYLWQYDIRTGGLSRYLTIEGTATNDNSLSILNAKGRVFAAITGGLYRESLFTSEEGYLIGPLGDFVSSANKSWVAATLETGTLGDGRVVELYYTTDPEALLDPDSPSWLLAMRRDAGGGQAITENLPTTVSRSLAGMVKMYSAGGETTLTPTVRSFSFAAYASSGDEDRIVTIPINVSDHIERRGMARRLARGAGNAAYKSLMALEGRPVILDLFTLNQNIRGVLEQVGTPVQALTKRGSPTLISMVRVRGRYEGVAGTTTGPGTFGTRTTFGTPPAFGVHP